MLEWVAPHQASRYALTVNDMSDQQDIIQKLVKKELSKGYSTFTKAEKGIYSVFWLRSQVFNGGFRQFFDNSYGDFSADVIPGLKMIGAGWAVPIVEQAFGVFPGGMPSSDRTERMREVDALSPEKSDLLEKLSEKLCEGDEELEEAFEEYFSDDE